MIIIITKINSLLIISVLILILLIYFVQGNKNPGGWLDFYNFRINLASNNYKLDYENKII